ncbi:potassium-transporting ATPase subunit KdpC [Pedococcus bigeumensis]|jgi:K+-transporting ATPase ATPase C chain|uniref:potassium-transporting ATPase subunit KdpC n=1 Tax=Pedococcus bigeumensis TaxID=433644 RepID=UPI002FE74065
MSSLRQLVASLRMLLVLTVLLGVLYPAVVWGVGRAGLSDRADGSLVSRDGRVVGSSLLGQDFKGPKWFHGRPSASAYAGGVSGGSNLAASAQGQVSAVRERQAAWPGIGEGAAPADALTASASGLDPHVSPANALAQVSRVAAANGVEASAVRQLVDAHTQGRSLGFLGEPRVNVLELNLALEELAHQ